MTKKDFITVSSVIRSVLEQAQTAETEERRHTAQSTIELIAQRLAAQFASINPRFDFDKFYWACGIQENTDNN